MKRTIVFFDMNPAITEIPIFQIGLCFIGGICLKKGYNCKIIEYSTLEKEGIESLTEELDTAACIGVSIRNIDNTEGSNPKSYLSLIYDHILYLSRNYSEKTVLGGSGFSIMPEEILNLFCLKYGIVGRGGYLWDLLLDWLNKGNTVKSFFDIGLQYNDKCKDIYNYEKLQYIWEFYPCLYNENKVLGFDTHTGCNSHCVYCTYPKISKGINCQRTPEEVYDFIVAANRKNLNNLQIVDDIFNSDLSYAKQICLSIIKAGNTIPIKCYISPNIDVEFARLLKEARVAEVVLGVDSLSDRVLRRMGKGFLEKDIYNARMILENEGINTVYTFIFGGPFETYESLNETKNNIFKHLPDKVTIQYGIRLYPHTPLFYMCSYDKKEKLDYCFPQFLKSARITEKYVQDVTEEVYSKIAIRKML